MSDNPSPSAQPDSEPTEFNFDKSATETPRIRRRSLKAKPAGLITPSANAPSAARELEREAPPLSAEQASRPASAATGAPASNVKTTAPVKTEPTAKSAPVAPPRTTPAVSSTASTSTATAQRPGTTSPSNAATQRPATSSASAAPANSATRPATPSSTTPAQASGTMAQKTSSTANATTTTSPHGTRPATLYYSSYPKKATSTPMKTSPAASAPAPSTSSSSSASPASTSTARPVAATPVTASRPAAANVDYRANVERQSREQKSVGNILAYVVYALIGLFVFGALLAGYGAYTINKQIHDQSVTVSDLDARYATATKDLSAKIAVTQDTLNQAQAQIARQQELITKQQEDINRLLAAINDNSNAIKTEAKTRAQETSALRARVRDVEYKTTTTQKY